MLHLWVITFTFGQDSTSIQSQEQAIHALIDHYAQARENKDTALLKRILSVDIDQLVSSGEWRNGMEGAMKGMMRSSTRNPGSRTLRIEKIRFLNSESGIVDARYEIQNARWNHTENVEYFCRCLSREELEDYCH